MFDPSPCPRVFALPAGVDFPAALVEGLRDRLPFLPEAMARVHLIVNTRRMARRLRDVFDAGPAALLPRISLVTDLGEAWESAAIPAAIPPLRRRLELARLILRLIEAQPDLAARASAFDLADSLAALMDEMQGEGVTPETIAALDVSDMSGHWARAQQFIGIVSDYLAGQGGRPDQQDRQRRVIDALADRWAETPPDHPVIVAGSTGSRGSTLRLMELVANLPQGAVVLPGFDFDQPEQVWTRMTDAETAEDHPQFRFSRIMQVLGLGRRDLCRWTDTPPPSPARGALVSLALRPAPFTDAWLEEGPGLRDIDRATSGLTLVEAQGPRAEALAIALRLREAAEFGQTAALITPDRMLTRRVTAMLDRWGILPDDSAGQPLHLTAPGRFLRHVAELFTQRLTAERLMTLLKHPICHSGADRGPHLNHSRTLELHLRRFGSPFPDVASLDAFARHKHTHPKPAPEWLAWAQAAFCGKNTQEPRALTRWIADLRQLAEAIARGTAPEGSGGLWDRNAGQKALAVIEDLTTEAPHGGTMTAHDFCDLLGALLANDEVRDRDAPHPRILILGTLEARVQNADLLILGGLNEGTWPEAARPDPWLNRRLRLEAGLLLPERRIGLSAHDFQQAIAAPEVWLTRSERSEDAETVASRWLNRLTNLLDGLDPQGKTALKAMRQRGDHWLKLAQVAETPPRLPRAPRPSPRPPVAARPRQLSVTAIKKLIRDPYAIYARHVLGLKPLDPLNRAPDALLRGIVLHDVLDRFVEAAHDDPSHLTETELTRLTAVALAAKVPWPGAQRLWLARLGRVSTAFVAAEAERLQQGRMLGAESDASLHLGLPDFTLTARADRVDRANDGTLVLYDYKTGKPPSVPEQTRFDKQLLLEAAMAEAGAFKKFDAAPVQRAVFIGVGTEYSEVAAPLNKEPPAKVLGDLRELIGAYLTQTRGFTSRRMMQREKDPGDYDQLARYGEWAESDDPEPEDLA